MVVTDPFDKAMVGIKYPKTEADIVTISHSHRDHNFSEGISGEPFVISLPGEYEVKGVSIFGLPSVHGGKSESEGGSNNLYIISAEGIKICHLGDLGALPDSQTLEEISGVDVLMIPVGGTYTFGPAEAAEAINKIEPRFVLPMHYGLPEVKELLALAPLEEFLKEMGAAAAEKLEKLSISKDKLPQETKVVLLERKS